MKFDRTKNAKKTVFWGMVVKIFSLFIPFVMRTIIIYTLGNLYTGLHSLFNAILNALNLAELGVGSALVFSMYKPVAIDDKKTIKALLNVYRLAYKVIGTFVGIAGLVLIPFLPKLIEGDCPNDANIYIIYVIQLAGTSFGYFFMAYKSSILNAYQRRDVIYIITLITEVLMYCVQALSLIIFKNYYFFIAATLVRQVFFNVALGVYVDKKYPDLKAEGMVSRGEIRTILKKTGALMGHKIAGVVINSIDNVFISAFIGLEMVTLYNNYSYVITAISGLFLMLTNGLHSIVGNYLIENKGEKTTKAFYMMHFAICLSICFCCTCFMNMFQPFMTIWIGSNSLFPIMTVALFIISFYSIRIRTVGLLFKDAAGLWEQDIIKSYAMIIIDLIIDITLLRTIGINGALISTIASMVFAFFYETQVVFKYCFHSSPLRYYLITCLYSGITFFSCFLSFWICSIITVTSSWVSLLVGGIVSLLISITSFIVFTLWTNEYRDFMFFLRKKIIKDK